MAFVAARHPCQGSYGKPGKQLTRANRLYVANLHGFGTRREQNSHPGRSWHVYRPQLPTTAYKPANRCFCQTPRRPQVLHAILEHLAAPRKRFLSAFRGGMMLYTLIAILAVDFHAFPRRYAKAEKYGTGLMDVGVGAIVFAGGLVSKAAQRDALGLVPL